MSRHIFDRQRGHTILEVLAVIVLGALLAAGVVAYQDQAWGTTREWQTAARQVQLSAAVQRYLGVHGAALAAGAHSAQPFLLPLDDLALAGYLPPGWGAVNAYGQTSCVALSAAPQALDAVVYTSGGRTIDAAALPAVAARAGAGAGYVVATAPIEARGAFGSWTLDSAALQRLAGTVCDGVAPAPGHLLTVVHQGLDDSAQGGAFLARQGDAAHQPVNVLATPLALASLAIASEGAACGTSPALALDAGRAILTCAATGRWQKNSAGGSWKEAAPDYDSLPKTDSPGDVRMVSKLGRAFVRNAKSGWPGLAADRWGALDVPGTMQANNLAISLHINIGDAASKTGNLLVKRDVHVGNDALVTHAVRARNQVASDWFVTESKHFHLGRPVVTAGAACNLARARTGKGGVAETMYPIGTMVADPQGITLSCQSPSNTFLYHNGKTTP